MYESLPLAQGQRTDGVVIREDAGEGSELSMRALTTANIITSPECHAWQNPRVIPWLREKTPFPPLESALTEPNGLLAASEDLIDLIHVHPFLADGKGSFQINILFPREGLYRVWTQVQRQNVVNTFAFTIPVKSL